MESLYRLCPDKIYGNPRGIPSPWQSARQSLATFGLGVQLLRYRGYFSGGGAFYGSPAICRRNAIAKEVFCPMKASTISAVVKGVTAGAVVGTATYMITTAPSRKKQMSSAKKSAGKALRAVGNVIENVSYMMK